MNNRFQGEEDVGFQNELTPEQIQQLLAMVQNMPQDRMPANMGESADLKQMQGMPSRPHLRWLLLSVIFAVLLIALNKGW